MTLKYQEALQKHEGLSEHDAVSKARRWQRCAVLQQVVAAIGYLYTYEECAARLGETEGFGGPLCAGAGKKYRGDSPVRNQVGVLRKSVYYVSRCAGCVGAAGCQYCRYGRAGGGGR